MRGSVFLLRLVAMAALAFPQAALAGEVLKEPPAKPDPAAHYIFYMHGIDIEITGGTGGKYPYDYEGILSDLARRGFVAIGERRSRVPPNMYARKVEQQVRGLLAAGVPPARITVAGHSKGGTMTLILAAALKNPAVNFVSFAGCAKPGNTGGMYTPEKIVQEFGPLTGRVLNSWDKADKDFGSCARIAAAAPGLVYEDKAVESGEGHELFRRPKPVWLDLLDAWARGKSAAGLPAKG